MIGGRQRGRGRLAGQAGGVDVDEVVVQRLAVVEAAGFTDREDPFDESVARVGLGSAGCPAPQDRVPERALSTVVVLMPSSE